jgi:hypothetical protein
MTKTTKSKPPIISTGGKKTYRELNKIKHEVIEYIDYIRLEGIPVNEQGDPDYRELIFLANMLKECGRGLAGAAYKINKEVDRLKKNNP